MNTTKKHHKRTPAEIRDDAKELFNTIAQRTKEGRICPTNHLNNNPGPKRRTREKVTKTLQLLEAAQLIKSSSAGATRYWHLGPAGLKAEGIYR